MLGQMKPFLPFLLVTVLLAPAAAGAAVLPPAISLQGELAADSDLSAVAALDSFLVVGSDEGAALQILEPTADGFRDGAPVPLPAGGEADIEGIAARRASAGGPWTVFAIGCHCGNRKQVEDDKTVAKNLERLAKVEQEGSRAHVYRFTVDAASHRPTGAVESKSLASVLENHPLLGRFAAVPSKENGIDIEGLAVGPDGKLFAGFRGPVLRGNFVPVLAFDFAHPEDAELRFVNLQGLGIRDLAAVRGGFLVLAGPVGDGRPDFRVFFWDGRDAIPGKDRSAAAITDLGEVPVPDRETKAEGLAVLAEDDRTYEVLLVYDGVPGGRLTRLTIDKPAR